jgi:hypothetical protein
MQLITYKINYFLMNIKYIYINKFVDRHFCYR